MNLWLFIPWCLQGLSLANEKPRHGKVKGATCWRGTQLHERRNKKYLFKSSTRRLSSVFWKKKTPDILKINKYIFSVSGNYFFINCSSSVFFLHHIAQQCIVFICQTVGSGLKNPLLFHFFKKSCFKSIINNWTFKVVIELLSTNALCGVGLQGTVP